MTRISIAVLLVLNAATLAWQWDAFARWGYGPNTAREPERLSRQIRPEALTIETPAAAAERIAAEATEATTEAPPSEPSGRAPVVPTASPSAPHNKAPQTTP